MVTETTNQIAHAHDFFFRTAMSDLRVAREFFSVHLPDEIRQAIDLKNLILQPRSYYNIFCNAGN